MPFIISERHTFRVNTIRIKLENRGGIKMTVSREKVLEKKLETLIKEKDMERNALRVLISYKKISYGKNVEPDEETRSFLGEFTIKIMIEPRCGKIMRDKDRKIFLDEVRRIFKDYESLIQTRYIAEMGMKYFGIVLSFSKFIEKGIDVKYKFKSIKKIFNYLLKDKQEETFKKEVNTLIEYR